jgi:MFS family permease
MAERAKKTRAGSVQSAALVGGAVAIFAAILSALVSLYDGKAHSAALGWLIFGLSFLGLFVGLPGIIVISWATRRFRPSSPNMLVWREARAVLVRWELSLIACLVILALAGFAVSYFASRSVFVSLQEQKFSPAETAQVITAAGGLGLAIDTSIAAIIKAYALLIRARADFIRAKFNLPPGEDVGGRADRQLSGPE